MSENRERERWLDRALFPHERQRIDVNGHALAYVDEAGAGAVRV